MGFNDFLVKIFGNKSSRDIREIQPWVEKIKAAYPKFNAMSNDELRAASAELKARIQGSVNDKREKIAELRASIENTDIENREPIFNKIDKLEKEILETLDKALDDALPDAFAIVKDTARRFTENETIVVTANDFDRELAATHDFVTIDGDKAIYRNHWQAGGEEVVWNMIHYDVQLFGGVVLHRKTDTKNRGYIAEMATGEGKTLVATLPVFLNALGGNGVHVVTVNDYLAKRDSEWMGPLYMFHGLSVDCIDKRQPSSEARRRAYLADITFGTNNEFGFDYLRDNMVSQPTQKVQRRHIGSDEIIIPCYAIVDEADSVLIDDARTPLIISGTFERKEDQMFEEYRPLVERLVDVQKKLATQLLAEAREKIYSSNKEDVNDGYVALFRSYKALPKNKPLIKLLSEPGVKTGLLKTEEVYIEMNNKRMPEAIEPLYFVIEEKMNSVDLTDKGVELISGYTSDPDFFVLPDIVTELSKLEGDTTMTLEEKATKKEELLNDYSIKSERVHTINQLLKAYTMFERDVEYVVTEDKQVKIVDEQTGRIMEGRRYSDGLHQAIEAKERVKVEDASQTCATITLQNYFRMYHKLAGMTGTAETEAGEFWDIYKLDVVVIPTNRPIARKDMNDRIYRTKREKYNAVIEEIEKLTKEGRPVLVGTTSVDISELLSRLLTIRKIPHSVLNAKQHQKEAEIVAKAGLPGTVTIATNMAGRGTDIKLTGDVRDAGGLAIIGTERHESRRVDRQLRGRSGRQGDPGSSVFFVSLEDNLMRLFGSDKIAKTLDRLGFKEGEMIEHKMISSSIENAQKKVEENNFGIRKRLIEYDNVMNWQRTAIYTRRNHALTGERIGMDIANIIKDCCQNIAEISNYDEAKLELLRLLATEMPFSESEFGKKKAEERTQAYSTAALERFKHRTETLAAQALPFFEMLYTKRPETHDKNVYVPITDGRHRYDIPVNVKLAYESGGKEIIKGIEKAIMLHVIDKEWIKHLRALDDLKQSVQNASYEQKDPMVIYKIEASLLFTGMIGTVNEKVITTLTRCQLAIQEQQPANVAAAPEQNQSRPKQQYTETKVDLNNTGMQNAAQRDTRENAKREPIRVNKSVGRNDPCPCGSGKKYKNCCGRNA